MRSLRFGFHTLLTPVKSLARLLRMASSSIKNFLRGLRSASVRKSLEQVSQNISKSLGRLATALEITYQNIPPESPKLPDRQYHACCNECAATAPMVWWQTRVIRGIDLGVGDVGYWKLPDGWLYQPGYQEQLCSECALGVTPLTDQAIVIDP